jgi:hypothetical protein
MYTEEEIKIMLSLVGEKEMEVGGELITPILKSIKEKLETELKHLTIGSAYLDADFRNGVKNS